MLTDGHVLDLFIEQTKNSAQGQTSYCWKSNVEKQRPKSTMEPDIAVQACVTSQSLTQCHLFARKY